ncbi:MAG: hypothetical protein ACKO24_06945 [Leptolyngbyaceae cyanobacterium]
MTKILIDNATISSVERALGKAPLKEPALLDIEHVALSRFSWEYSSSDGKNILVQKGLEDRSVRITPPTTILGIKIEGDDSSIKLRIPSVLYKKYFIGRKYRAFVKRVMEELAVPAQYGNLKTKLNSYAWVQEDRFPKFYLRQDRFPFKFHKPFTTASLEPSQVEKHNNSGAAD